MKKIITLMALSLLLMAGTYKKDVQIGTGSVGIDSVVAIIEVDNTEIDSVLWKVFAVDSFITLPDTAIVTIAWFYFYTDDAAATVKFTTAYEQIPAHDITTVSGADASFTVVAFDTTNVAAIQGTSITGYNLADQAIVLGTTDGNGQVIFGLKTGDTVYFNATGPVGYLWVQNDTTKGITNNGVDSVRGTLFAPAAPAAGKTAAVTVFITNNDRTPAENVAVSAYLSRSRVVDSAGFPVYNQTQTLYTDSDGKVIFTCIWSSYMIPATQWYFSTSVPGTIKKKITIPRETTVTLDLR